MFFSNLNQQRAAFYSLQWHVTNYKLTMDLEVTLRMFLTSCLDIFFDSTALLLAENEKEL